MDKENGVYIHNSAIMRKEVISSGEKNEWNWRSSY
jgi:hypothetical protein